MANARRDGGERREGERTTSSLPALPSVPPHIRHSRVAPPLRVGGAAAAAQILMAGRAEERQSGKGRGGGDVA